MKTSFHQRNSKSMRKWHHGMKKWMTGSLITQRRSRIRRLQVRDRNQQLVLNVQPQSTQELQRALEISTLDISLTTFFNLILICQREPLKTMSENLLWKWDKQSLPSYKKSLLVKSYQLVLWLISTIQF